MISAGVQDIRDGGSRWRVWHLLGVSLLRQRYARSRMGQAWITISTAITTASFGLLWSQLWGRPIAEYLPYITATHVLWTLITGPLLDATGALPANAFYYTNQKAPFSTVFFANLYRNLLISAHNVVIIIAVCLIFQTEITPWIVLLVPGLLLNLIFAFNLSLVIGIVCARFRDMSQVVGNALQVVYFLSPVMWMPEFLPERARWLVDWNPFAQFLAIMRDPILGRPIEAHAWVFTIALTLASLVLAPLCLSATRKRLVYWL